MSDESLVTTPATPVKAKKSVPKPTHPKYSVMVGAALNALKERRGSSRQAILKYIIANYKVKENSVGVRLKLALRRGVADGSLQQMKGSGAAGSFKLVKNDSGTNSDAPKQRGRPKGSKNIKKADKPAAAKKVHAKKSGRPAGSKKVAKKASTAKKTTGKPGRPAGSKNKKPADAKESTGKKTGRPKGSKNVAKK